MRLKSHIAYKLAEELMEGSLALYAVLPTIQPLPSKIALCLQKNGD